MFKVLGVKQHFLKIIEVYGVKWHIIYNQNSLQHINPLTILKTANRSRKACT